MQSLQYQVTYLRALYHMYQAKRWLRKAAVTAAKLAAFVDECKKRGEDTRALVASDYHAKLVETIARVEATTKDLPDDESLEEALEKFNKQTDELLAQGGGDDPYAN